MAVVGKDIRFTCSAASSSSSPVTFAWKKDNEVLANADMENFAHARAQDGKVTEYTTVLHLRHVTFGHEGRYQCVITNHFGSTYSHKARLIVNGKAVPWTGVSPLKPRVVLCDRVGRMQAGDTGASSGHYRVTSAGQGGRASCVECRVTLGDSPVSGDFLSRYCVK